jgi:NTE family protein
VSDATGSDGGDTTRVLDVARALAAVPLFAAVPPDERDALVERATTRTFARGDRVFEEGDESFSCFVVVAGEVDVTPQRHDGVVAPVRRLGPNEIFGELGVLLGRPRSATVTATRAATLIELPADELRQVITSSPLALEQVSRLLAGRLVATTRGDPANDTPRVVAVTGEPRVKGRSFVAATVAALLHTTADRPTVWLELTSAPPTPGPSEGADVITALDEIVREPRALADAIAAAPTRWAGGTAHLRISLTAGAARPALLAEAVELFRDRFTFVVVDVPDELALPLAVSAELADASIHVSHRLALAPPPQGGRRLVVHNLFDDRAQPIALNRNEPFVLRRDDRLASMPAEAGAELVLGEHLTPVARTLRRLTRTLLGTTVGVALGGGAAFGLAHVGVLEVLDDACVPVDLVVGTSMGSIVATGYAAGIPSADMHQIAERVGRSPRTLAGLVDLNPTAPGLLSGRRLQRTFNPLLGSAETFADLVVPCQTVAADIESGQRVCIGSGRLEDAFRASSSIPLLIAPWVHDGKVLVDGAIVDPVPAEVARDMGADLVFSVNVVPHLRRGVTTVISRVTRSVSILNPLSLRHRGLPNFADTLMNTIQTLQHELGHFKAASADVRINPELADITWVEFYRAPEIIRRGQEAAEEALPDIRRALAERLAAALPG